MRAALAAGWLRALVLLTAAAAAGGVGRPALAHDDSGEAVPNIIRDTEIENDIRTLETPVWNAAGLDPQDVGIYMVNSDDINSFVAGGQNIFINTGLIERAKTPDQLIGVLAHETGHIVNGHILDRKEDLHNASVESIIAMVFAAAAAALGHNGAPLIGAAAVGQRHFLQSSVGIEATADHAALNFLDRACLSARGLLRFFKVLQSDEMLSGTRETPYLMDHPLTQERIDYVRDHIERARCSNAPDRPGSAALLRTIQVKLHAFLDPPAQTLATYPASDKSALARYARAIAYYRIPDLKQAVPAIDGLIREFSDNPYYRELKGQMLFENGRTGAAIAPYEAAVRLMPSAPLLRISLSQVYLETGDPALDKRAIAYLQDASREEHHDSALWHFLAVAYGRNGQRGMAALALAEEALENGRKKDALLEANRAQHLLSRNADGYGRAQEINREAKQLDDE